MPCSQADAYMKTKLMAVSQSEQRQKAGHAGMRHLLSGTFAQPLHPGFYSKILEESRLSLSLGSGSEHL